MLGEWLGVEGVEGFAGFLSEDGAAEALPGPFADAFEVAGGDGLAPEGALDECLLTVEVVGPAGGGGCVGVGPEGVEGFEGGEDPFSLGVAGGEGVDARGGGEMCIRDRSKTLNSTGMSSSRCRRPLMDPSGSSDRRTW